MDTSTNEELEDGELVDEESAFPKLTSTLRDFIDDMEMDDPRDEEESDSPKLTSTTHDCSNVMEVENLTKLKTGNDELNNQKENTVNNKHTKCDKENIDEISCSTQPMSKVTIVR